MAPTLRKDGGRPLLEIRNFGAFFGCSSGVSAMRAVNVGAIMDRLLSSFVIRCMRAVNDRPYRTGQKFATWLDFNCSCSLSAISAINSELVGLPFVLLTV